MPAARAVEPCHTQTFLFSTLKNATKKPFIFFKRKEKGRWMGVSPIVFFKKSHGCCTLRKTQLEDCNAVFIWRAFPFVNCWTVFFSFTKKKSPRTFPQAKKSQLTRVTLYEALLTRFSIQRRKKKYGTARRIV